MQGLHISHTESPILADGSIPMLPVIIEASSDNISPNMLLVTIVSNCSKTKHTILTLELYIVTRGLPCNTTKCKIMPSLFNKITTCLGLRTSCIAALSTYMCESSTSGYCEAMAVTLFLQSMDAWKRKQNYYRYIFIKNFTSSRAYIWTTSIMIYKD